MNHYRLYKNLNMQPFLEEINSNDDWVSTSMPFGWRWPGSVLLPFKNKRIELIKSYSNSNDLESKTLSPFCTDINTVTEASTYTGVVPTEIFWKYKTASSFLGWFKKTHNAQIARVRYVKIPSKSYIGHHIDGGPYYENHDRFHLVLQSEYQYTVNGETLEYKEGEIWWFNNKKMHGTYIHGSKDRIAMIFDCKCDMERIINDPE